MSKHLIIIILAAIGAFSIFSFVEYKVTEGIGYLGYEKFIYYIPYFILSTWIGFNVGGK